MEVLTMKVAITGGSGFIGEHVVEELKSRSYEPVVVDRVTGGDILAPDLCSRVRGCEAVIHLAGVLGTLELFGNAEHAVDVNVKGALRVLQECQDHHMRFVGITMPQVWTNVYQATKGCAQKLASAWHQCYGVPVSHVRAFNAYGPGQKVYGVQKIIPTFALKAWCSEPIPIWGTGEQTVDLIYVGDIAKILVDALSYGNDDIFDAGTGLSLTVNEVAQQVLSITGSTAGIEYLPMRAGELEYTKLAACGEGWNLLGWKPEWNAVEFERTIFWYQQFAVRPAA
jgi:UDP-glucose 4-epimerase